MDFGRILKTSAVAGVIYGILQGIVAVLSYVFYRQEIIDEIRASIPSGTNIPMTMDQLADIGMIAAVPASIVGGIIAAIIVCVIFSLMYDELLGSNSKKKGLFLCLLMLGAVALGELVHQGIIGGVFMVQTRFIMLTPISAAFFVALGYMLGIFYDRFGAKRKGAECKVKK